MICIDCGCVGLADSEGRSTGTRCTQVAAGWLRASVELRWPVVAVRGRARWQVGCRGPVDLRAVYCSPLLLGEDLRYDGMEMGEWINEDGVMFLVSRESFGRRFSQLVEIV